MRVRTFGAISIVHRGDMSGELEIRNGDTVIKMPSRVIFELVADYLRDRRISVLEQATTEELLGGVWLPRLRDLQDKSPDSFREPF